MRHNEDTGLNGPGEAMRHRFLARFMRDESGVMIALALFLLLTMLLLGGIGVDFMRQEMERAKVQGVLDRAVLAAADMDQKLAPKAVVEDYFAKTGMSDYLTSVTVDQGSTYRIVNAKAGFQMKTQFLKAVGLKTLKVPAAGTAEESLGDAEVSLVLDISGSMGDNQKMVRLRAAAKDFLDTVLLDESMGHVSVSVIPYTSQVNAGAAIMNRLNVKRVHGYSSCINFDDEDFLTTAISTTKVYTQGEHFETYGNSSPIHNPGCPSRESDQIIPLTQDKQKTKSTISQMNDRANTSIHIGMKWGVALVDPSMRPVVSDMVAKNLISADFAGRPSDYGSGGLKTVILMTDGENVSTVRIRDKMYATPDQRYHWHRNPLIDWVNAHASSMHNDFYYTRSSASQADALLDKICTAAKNRGILVWTVGFEVGDHGASVMRKCASSPSHFFRVDGVEISEAFKSIARELNRLKLTQ